LKLYPAAFRDAAHAAFVQVPVEDQGKPLRKATARQRYFAGLDWTPRAMDRNEPVAGPLAGRRRRRRS